MTRLIPTRSRSVFVEARCLAVLVAVVSIVWTSRASAAAPICDPSGASAVAPTPAPPSATGDLVAPKTCDDSDGVWALRGTAKPGRDGSSAERAAESASRVLPVQFVWPDQRGVRLPRAEFLPPAPRPGFSEPVYRPPRA